MDVTTPIVFGSIFVIASVSLFLVYKFGMKKKSYEEALAEQRQQTSALLAAKPKAKEKRNKKIAKKLKEKPAVAALNEETITAEEPTEPSVSQQSKHHVEFKEEREEVEIPPSTEDVKEIQITNKKQVKKVRPILLKKGPSIPEQVVTLDTPLNHFEEIKPKDEFELLKISSKEELNKIPVQVKTNEKEKPQKKAKHKVEQQHKIKPTEPLITEEQKEFEEKVTEIKIVPLDSEPALNVGKEKKKKKNDNNLKHPRTMEIDELTNLVRKAELSRTEVQMLIDLLLNKQLEAPSIIDEWTEGKSDPVQKLKKQLAEREKQLADEQEALVGVQAKLKEIRNVQLTERTQWQQKLKLLEESKLELVAANNHFQQKILEIQERRDEDLVNVQKIIDENSTLKVKLINYQETEGLIHTLRTENEHLGSELQRLSREMQEQQQGYVMQINNLQQEAKENIRALQRGHEFAVHKQMDEMRGLSEELQRLKNEYGNIYQERQDLANLLSQLRVENEQLREERDTQINGSTEESKAQEIKVLNLTNDLSSIRNELSSATLKFKEAEQNYKAELALSDQKLNKLHSEMEEQKQKNNELRQKNWKVMEALNAAESRNLSAKNSTADVDKISTEAHREFILEMFPDIEDLRRVTSSDWRTEFERIIKMQLSRPHKEPATSLENVNDSRRITTLQAENQHYQKLIDDTDKLLNNLQLHIANEEIKWRSQLVAKDSELQRLNGDVSKLLEKVASLESQVLEERTRSNRLLGDGIQIRNKNETKVIHSDATSIIEKLSEEVDRLREQLRLEDSKKSDIDMYQKAQNYISNSTNGSVTTEDVTS
ncbi:ribosome-binding protein 1-like isoform X2 [Cylas formicarius]|uniref:ribosome-binding protein 1-like isoform X2 n=2 Tax=Cylas formicarius TaxID=197179 RepID=UPI002958A4FB|nr:ribosome-binding protein 1-like isoform X2 [Cylas formicarius]